MYWRRPQSIPPRWPERPICLMELSSHRVSHDLHHHVYDPLTRSLSPDPQPIAAEDLLIDVPHIVSQLGSRAYRSPLLNVKRAENLVKILGDERGVSFPRYCPLMDVVVWNPDHSPRPLSSCHNTHSCYDDLPFTIDPALDPPTSVNPSTPTRNRLTSHSFPPDEAIPRIKEVITSKDETGLTGYSSDDTAQTFIDVVNEVCHHTSSLPRHGLISFTLFGSLALDLPPSTNQTLDLPDLPPRLREVFSNALYRACSHWTLLPRSLQIPLCYNRSTIPQCRGGYADVWKGEYQGHPVAAKVLRVYSTSEFHKIRRVGRLVAQRFKHPC